MYQLFNFTILLALLDHTWPILWVRSEGATPRTVLLVSALRIAGSLEARVTYFIHLRGGQSPRRCSARVLRYFLSRSNCSGAGAVRFCGPSSRGRAISSHGAFTRLRLSAVCYGTKWGWYRLSPLAARPHADGPTPVRPCSRACCLNVAL